MNRSITECYSAALPADRQGEVFHRYILGVYDLYERLNTAFPQILLSPVQAAADVLIRESFIMRHRDGPVMIQMRQSV